VGLRYGDDVSPSPYRIAVPTRPRSPEPAAPLVQSDDNVLPDACVTVRASNRDEPHYLFTTIGIVAGFMAFSIPLPWLADVIRH
jgi:hypothetical protein